MRFHFVLCCLLLLGVESAAAAQHGISMDEFLTSYTAPMPDVVWSPDGKALVYTEAGTLYEWRAGWREKRARVALSKLETAARGTAEPDPKRWQNRRVQESTLQWFPDSQDLLVSSRGNLFVVHRDGQFDQLTATPENNEDPKLSPDGTLVAYRQHHNLFALDLRTRATRQLTMDGTATLLNGEMDWVYPEELDLHTAIWWSPDSSKIAFLQFDVSQEFIYTQTNLLGLRAIAEPQRYPQAGTPNAVVKVGIIDVASGDLHWMDAGASPDVLVARVAWLPDSSAVAVEVLPRLQNALDLLVCNARTGAARTVLHEASKDWINIAEAPVFLQNRREFLWTSERSGFRHLFRYSIEGSLLVQITSGNWQVNEIAAVNEQTGTIYYTSSEGSPLESHLWSVPLRGGLRTQLTQPGFDHAVKTSAAGTAYVDRYSNVTTPPETVVHYEGSKDVRLRDQEHANSHLLPAEIVTVKGRGDVQLYGKLLRPAGFKTKKKYPLIVHVYGGPGAQQVRNAWSGADWDQLLAARGFVVWELDNRGSMGRGHAFESPLFHTLGKHEVEDQRTGVDYLIGRGFVDRERVGVTGWSYGGYMTIRCLLTAGDLFKVGVAGAPVTDWRNYDTIYTERYMGLPDKDPSTYDAASNVKATGDLKGQLLIVHNLEDDNVLFQNTAQLTQAFEEAGKNYSLQVYPDRTHHVSSTYNRALFGAMTEYLERNLKPGANVP